MKISLDIYNHMSMLLIICDRYDIFKNHNLDVVLDFDNANSDVSFISFSDFLTKASDNKNICASKIVAKSYHKSFKKADVSEFLLLDDKIICEFEETFEFDLIDEITTKMFDFDIKPKQVDFLLSVFKKSVDKQFITKFHFCLNEAVLIHSKLSIHDKINLLTNNAIVDDITLDYLVNQNYQMSFKITMADYKQVKKELKIVENLNFNELFIN